MNRKQLYNEITSLGLQGEVQATYGKNYTTCSNAQLQAVVDSVRKSMPTEVGPSSFQRLVDILAKKKILLKSEVEAIMKA